MSADSPQSDPKKKSAKRPSDSESGSANVFDIDRIRQIVELMKEHELNEVDLQQSDDRIRLTRGGAAPAPAIMPQAYLAAQPSTTPAAPAASGPPASGAAPVAAAGTVTINSPMVGTFYSKANPGAPPFVKVGDSVSEDTVVCIIEAMKVFNEIPAECSGKVVEVLVNDQEPVDFGKPLFRVQTGG